MSEPQETDRATVVPPAAPLTGEPAETGQPSPAEVLGMADAAETDHLVSPDDQ